MRQTLKNLITVSLFLFFFLNSVKKLEALDSINHLAVLGDRLYFYSEYFGGYALFGTNGTKEGTYIVSNVPGQIFSSHAFQDPTSEQKNALLLSVNLDLWRSNGSRTQTSRIDGFTLTIPAPFSSIINNNGSPYMLFSANTGGTGLEPCIYDGSLNGTRMVTNLNPGSASSDPRNFAEIANSGQVLFSAITQGIGRELFVTNGTEQGTRLVKDINPFSANSNPQAITYFPRTGLSYFVAVLSNHRQLWRTDTTELGTTILRIFNANGHSIFSSPEIVVYNNHMYFAATNDTRFELYRSDGTTANSGLFRDINSGDTSVGSNPSSFIVFKNMLYFNAYTKDNGTELHRTDGTVEGTILFKDLQPGAGSGNPRNFVISGDKLYFLATGAGTGRELFVSDGTAEGTGIVKDIIPGSTPSDITNMTPFNGLLYFVVRGNLWRTDGTESGTYEIVNIQNDFKPPVPPQPSPSPSPSPVPSLSPHVSTNLWFNCAFLVMSLLLPLFIM